MGRKRHSVGLSQEMPIKKKTRKGKKRKHVNSWVKLPYPAMEKVLENLTDCEKFRTAQVCQSWKHAFQNPRLWRTRHFEFGGPKANASGSKALAFVRTKGQYLQRVFVTCHHVTSNTCENITHTLEAFVSHLEDADLEEFHISGLELDRFWKYGHLRAKVADSLLELLRQKRNLKVLELSQAQLGLLPGAEILQTVAQACGTKLCKLLLEDFFHSYLAVFDLDQFKTALQSFSNLTVVSLNYCCIYDELIKTWAETLKGKLETLRIKACDNEAHAHTISDWSWKALVLSCPNLILDLSIVGIGPASSLIPILAPHAPLTSLHIWSGYDNDIPLQVASAIYELIRERQTVLTSADIMLCAVSDPSMELLRDLREEMQSLAQERGISLVLQNDLF
ncbi:hypothetical protein EGW08_010614 [Elysia chlorotica]|uniref:F-box domain-containing protein n=1 Tax=Elysia chlorotica TaxID=188477 RepID=A0A433TJA0_ELYCH|nr:hypothetical protein EGW08_010614 [Elysia chlorotica]